MSSSNHIVSLEKILHLAKKQKGGGMMKNKWLIAGIVLLVLGIV